MVREPIVTLRIVSVKLFMNIAPKCLGNIGISVRLLNNPWEPKS